MKLQAGWLFSAFLLCGLATPAACAADEGLPAAVRGSVPAPAPVANAGGGAVTPTALDPATCDTAASADDEALPCPLAQSRAVGDPAEAPRGPGRPQGWRALLPGALR